MPTDILPKITTGHVLSIQGILGIIRCTPLRVHHFFIIGILIKEDHWPNLVSGKNQRISTIFEINEISLFISLLKNTMNSKFFVSFIFHSNLL